MTRQEAQHRIAGKRLAMDVIESSLRTINANPAYPLGLLEIMVTGLADPASIKQHASTQLACWTLREELAIAFRHIREFYDARDAADPPAPDPNPHTRDDAPPSEHPG